MSNYTKSFLAVLLITELLMLSVHFRYAGIFLGLSLLGGVVYSFYNRNIGGTFMIAWIIGFSPLVVFIRPFIFFESGYTMITIVVIILAFFTMKKELNRAISNKNIFFILLFFIIFVAVGIIEGVKVGYFIKTIELGTTLVLISMLLYFPEYRAFAMRNFIYSSIAIYIVMFPNIANRFATPTEVGWVIGGDPSGPASLLVISLIFLLLDQGKLIMFKRDSKILLGLTIVVFILLFLSTSRTNMISMLFALIFYGINNRADFLKYFLVMLAMLTLSFTILDDKYFNTIEKFYVKKLDTSHRSLNQVTTSRFVQWQVGLHYLDTAPLLDVLLGYGPNSRGFLHDEGKNYVKDFGYVHGSEKAYVIHTLYLKLAVEYGIIAFSIFMYVLLRAAYVNFKLYLKKQEMLLYFTIAYMFSIMGNAGMSVIGGIFMAFIFAGPKIFNKKYLIYDERMKI
ncbi:MAG: hypothetical protein COA44_00605 [Arcobacter sp.]|nr:MAG: hypothetical protein COA44_00605 [Arcobacter sp.]